MEYILKNDILTVTLTSVGGELVSIYKDGVNRMHTPTDDTWNGVSPVLFPLVSRLKDNTWSYNGVDYEIPGHGFIRKNEMEVKELTNNSITFVRQYSQETLKMYPFKFNFEIKYTLVGAKIDVDACVYNLDDKDMYYMIGGHPSFSIPLYNNESIEDYYLSFEKKENVNTLLIENNVISPNTKKYLDNESILSLKGKQADLSTTIMLKKLTSNYLYLKSEKSDYEVKFEFRDSNTLAFWTNAYNKNNSFICIEPWYIQENFVKEMEKMNLPVCKVGKVNKHHYSFELIK